MLAERSTATVLVFSPQTQVGCAKLRISVGGLSHWKSFTVAAHSFCQSLASISTDGERHAKGGGKDVGRGRVFYKPPSGLAFCSKHKKRNENQIAIGLLPSSDERYSSTPTVFPRQPQTGDPVMWRVIPGPDSTSIHFELNAVIGLMLNETSTLAKQVFKDLDRERWQAVAPGLLQEADHGIDILERLASSQSSDLTDEECHVALRACCFLAIQIQTGNFTDQERLVVVMQMLAEAYPCELRFDQRALPHPTRIQGADRWPAKLQKLYATIRKKRPKSQPPVLPLSDCCCLLLGFPDESRDDLPGLVTELWRVSDSYRQALRLLLGRNK
jgi:hypothetical protein